MASLFFYAWGGSEYVLLLIGVVLINYFGNNDEQFKVQAYEDNDFANATYFIMSDGISDYIPKERLYELMTKNVDGFDLIRLIVGEAMNQGSSDDTSIIILEVS